MTNRLAAQTVVCAWQAVDFASCASLHSTRMTKRMNCTLGGSTAVLLGAPLHNSDKQRLHVSDGIL